MSPLSPQRTHAPQASPQRGEKRKSPVRLTTSLSSHDSKKQKLFYGESEATSQQQVAPSSQNPSISHITTEEIPSPLTSENLPYIAESFTHIRVFKKKNQKEDRQTPEQKSVLPYIDFELAETNSNSLENLMMPKGFEQISKTKTTHKDKKHNKTISPWLEKSKLDSNIFRVAKFNGQNKFQHCPLSFKILIKLFIAYQDYHLYTNPNPINNKTLKKMPFNKEFVRGLLIMKNMIADLKNDKGDPKFIISNKFDRNLLEAIAKHNQTSEPINRSVFNIMPPKK